MKSAPTRFRQIAAVCAVLFNLMSVIARAQPGLLDARVSHVSGTATFSRPPSASVPLRKGDALTPGDELVTGSNGRVVIALSDGSQVIVQPNTRLRFKDFHQAGSLRELLDVTLGRVRLKINKLNGRPNPYRVNSPAASIAVRGTEFDVRVAASGETRVAVYEGLVEVTSRLDPNQRRLVEPGRSVIVRPNGDLSWFAPGPGGELRGQVSELSQYKAAEGSYAQKLEALELTQVIYERNVTNLIETNLRSQPAAFTAFADAQFDSLLNPAYAAEIARPTGRMLQMSSFNHAFTRVRGGTSANELPGADQNAALQLSYFAPVGDRWIIGGALTVGRSRLQSLTYDELRVNQGPGLVLTETLSGSLSATNVNAALLAARRFGQTSLGVAVERLEGRSAFATHQVITLDYPRLELGTRGELAYGSRAELGRTRLTAGLKHDLANGQKLGAFFRISDAAAELRYQHQEYNIAFADAPVTTQQRARALEVGGLWRAVIRQKLFFGTEGLLTFERPTVQSQYEQSRLSLASDARRVRFGGGVGYAFRPQTVFSLDAAVGQRQADRRLPFSSRDESGRFVSLHAGAQTDAAKWFFFNVSATALWERGYTDNCLASFALASGPGCNNRFVNAGVGRRFTPHWAAQYLFSTDFRRRGPSHSVVLRYTFDAKEKQ